jgi:hypothetical protein
LFEASETISPAICAASIALSIIATGALYFVGPFWSNIDF